ncbi:hypothetical protein ABZ863_16470 [Saccharomonospora sp. NPDC046836]|uniref:hypothetical protein n=1 Tax=Saccharomonospora sp. NPDC046836 TaxID=3156921 RepID=UPI0033D98BEB
MLSEMVAAEAGPQRVRGGSQRVAPARLLLVGEELTKADAITLPECPMAAAAR